MKNIFYSFILLCAYNYSFAQIQSLDFLLDYNCESNLYEVKLKILEGEATTVIERAQFNSQISLVVPTGDTFSIVETFAPLLDNQEYEGTIPLAWRSISPVFSPGASPENDFYAIGPKLNTASFYNDLSVGDEVHLFSLRIGDGGVYDERVRFYNNGQDPGPTADGLGGGNFKNGFTLGNSMQIYSGNLYRSCITGTNNLGLLEAKVYPNPFQNEITIDCEDSACSVTIYNMFGSCVLKNEKMKSNTLTLATYFFDRGIYYIKLNSEKGDRVIKMMKY